MTARIFKPAKNAMQSGRAKTREWQLDYEPEQPRAIEPLMGWTSSGDMKQQLTLRFDSRGGHCLPGDRAEGFEAAAGRLFRQFCVPARRTLDPLISAISAPRSGVQGRARATAEIAWWECRQHDISKVRVALDRAPMTP